LEVGGKEEAIIHVSVVTGAEYIPSKNLADIQSREPTTRLPVLKVNGKEEAIQCVCGD
jgi:hypothetical protein